MTRPGWKERALNAEREAAQYREALQRAATALWHADAILNDLVGHTDSPHLEAELFWFEHRADDINDVLNGTVTNDYDDNYRWGPLEPLRR